MNDSPICPHSPTLANCPTCDGGDSGSAGARGSAAKRAREVLLYCKLWTEGDVQTLHLRPERKVLEHRIRVISEAIQMLDALPPNGESSDRESGTRSAKDVTD